MSAGGTAFRVLGAGQGVSQRRPNGGYAFPLDGGRLLQSLIWLRSGDRLRATRIAVRIGMVFAYLLIVQVDLTWSRDPSPPAQMKRCPQRI
jgi:hypothetical protein